MKPLPRLKRQQSRNPSHSHKSQITRRVSTPQYPPPEDHHTAQCIIRPWHSQPARDAPGVNSIVLTFSVLCVPLYSVCMGSPDAGVPSASMGSPGTSSFLGSGSFGGSGSLGGAGFGFIMMGLQNLSPSKEQCKCEKSSRTDVPTALHGSSELGLSTT